jgi:cysteine desulfurase/selenocysteine lyase
LNAVMALTGDLEAADRELVARARSDQTSRRVHLNHAGMSLTPAPVLARVLTHLELEAEIGGYEAAAEVADEMSAVPAALAPLFGPGVGADEMAAVESATRAWEVALWALVETFDYTAGDRVLVDQFAYATVYTTLRRARAARGIEVDVVASHPDGSVDVDRLADMIDPRTRLVSVTHMPTHLGVRSDVEGVGRVLAGRGIVYALDVAQTLGQMPIDVGAIGCQIAYGPGRKFVRAPRGTAALYVEADLAGQLVPLSPGFGSVSPSDPDTFALAPGARRFDSFEYGHAARLGLGAAARYATDFGLTAIERLVAARSRDVAERLEATPGVRLVASPDAVGIVSFVHQRLTPDEVWRHLSGLGVNVWVNPAGGAPLDDRARPVLPSVRVSPHYVTGADDLDRLSAALATLASR